MSDELANCKTHGWNNWLQPCPTCYPPGKFQAFDDDYESRWRNLVEEISAETKAELAQKEAETERLKRELEFANKHINDLMDQIALLKADQRPEV